MKRTFLLIPILVLLLVPVTLIAQQTEPGRLTVDSIFTYSSKSLGPVRWTADGSGYLALEPSANKKGSLDIVRYDALSGERSIKVPAEKLAPTAASEPLGIEEFDFSQDEQKLLIFTNSERVWRSNTRGDYWVLDLKTWNLRKLGGDAAKPSTLMFAKFSPDGTRVGYVRENNIYIENLGNNSITQLTTDGSRYLVNGTFDWVYEEELFCRDGWRWSPDGKQIAYWQLNSEGVKEMHLINNTAGLYPVITSFPYPKAGETNSAARVGVIGAAGGATRWFDISGDPRNNYLPRMEWAASSNEVIIQQLNRLAKHECGYARRHAHRKGASRAYRKGRRLGRHSLGRHRLGQDRSGARRCRMDRWRQAFPLGQRTRRLATHLFHLARRQRREVHHAGQL